MNRRIGRLGAVFVAAFLVLVANLTYLQFFGAGELTAKPENIRPLLYEKRIERGKIVSADGVVLADSRKQGDTYERIYPHGALFAHITGFYSTKYGRAGLELTHNDYLSGQSKVSSIDDYIKRLLGKDAPGNDIYLTIDTEAQAAAKAALAGNKGAVVALDPRTGAVLALVSQPGFDPNAIDARWKELSESPDGVLVNRATQGRFTPGSSFKIVTAAAALEEGVLDAATEFEAPATLTVHGGKVTNYGDEGLGTISFAEAFTKSVNTVFAQVGIDLGAEKLVEHAREFGFNGKVPFDLPVAASALPGAGEMDPLEVAWAAVGQGRIEASPLAMALVGAAVAQRGEIKEPYLVEKAVEHDGQPVFTRKTRTWRTPMTPETAEALKGLMEQVVEKGTGRAAQITDVRVAGKTGTAEVGDKGPHAWFVGFAPVDDPRVVVAVIVEHGGTGGRVAAPIARKVMLSIIGKSR